MKTARLGSTLAIAAMTVAAAGAAWSLGSVVQTVTSPYLRALAVGLGTALISSSVLLPIAWSFDRNMQQLRSYLAGLMEDTDDEDSASFEGARWLRPLVHSCTALVDHWRQRTAQA
ncbi:MAG TPA: hypothetical protein ENJ06_05360, partial [Phycisphaeraceae bacterium]|nr:hypothetical protein [Phycisphaeraceae bacterium]